MENIENLENRPPRDIDVVTICRRPTSFSQDQEGWVMFVAVNADLFQPQLAKEAFLCDGRFIDRKRTAKYRVAGSAEV